MIRNIKLINMKNKLKIISLAVLGIFLFTTCSEDPTLPMPDLQQTVIPLITKDPAKLQNISFFDLAGFSASVVVDVYNDDVPQSMTVMVCMNGDQAKTGVLQADITSFPTSIDFNITKLIDVIPGLDNLGQLKLGDNFKVYVDMTLKDGTVILGNSLLYSPFDPAVGNLPGSSLVSVWTIVCPLVLTDFVGDYLMDDGYPSDLCTITVSLDPANPNGLIITNFYAGTGTGALYPVKISVNRATYGISVPSPQVFAAWLWNPAYKDATLSNLKGTLDACTKNFSFKADLTVSVGSFGTQSYTCTKL